MGYGLYGLFWSLIGRGIKLVTSMSQVRGLRLPLLWALTTTATAPRTATTTIMATSITTSAVTATTMTARHAPVDC